MSGKPDRARASGAADWLTGGGAMGKLIREMDWSKTPLGPIESWPQSLRTTVSLCLASNFPISIAWGPHRTQIYNDGYWPICGAKHPHSMGQDFRECWFSAWPAIGEAFEHASAGETTFLVNERMFLDRNGYLEETFFTFSFSPIRDETGGVGGLFHPVTEMTDQTLAERRLKVLSDLADRTTDAKTVEEACRLITESLAEHELDLPFALLYLFDADGKRATLASSAGIQPETAISPDSVDLSQETPTSWPLADVASAGRPEEVNDLEGRFGSFSCGPYPEPPKTAYALPIVLPGLELTFGALVAGVSSRRALDDAYRTFYRMLSDRVSNALANARAYEEERKRAEALAEIDRAKTVFFSNVSHEFRTPLTLMLGPLEDTLAEGELPPQARGRSEVARRNSLRRFREMIDALPAAIYTTDAEGRLTHFNPAAVELSGRTPRLGTDQWCVSWKLYYPDGAPMPHDECPMAVALKEGRIVQGQEVIGERPDGTRVWFEPYPTPLRDAEDRIVGGINMLLDITERKRREHVTALLGAIVDSSDDAIVSKDLNGVITSWNKSAERMFGYTAQEMIGQPCAVMIPEDRSHEESQINEKLRRGEGVEHFKTVRVRKDGSRLDVSLTISPVRDTEGRIVGASKIARDITERKRAEDKLAEALRRLHAHVDNSPLAAVEFDSEWRVITWSGGAERMFGWSAAEILGKRIKDLRWVYKADADGVDALCADMLTGLGLRYDYVNRNYRKDGSVIECEWYNSVLRDANGKMVSCSSQVLDITERKRAEEALREREQRYRALTELSPQHVFVTRPDGYITYVNQYGQEFTGRTLAEMQGDGWAECIHPEHRERVFNIWQTAIREVSEYSVEFPFLYHDGTYRRLYARALPVRDDAGAVAYWIGTAVDVEDLKRAEDELRKSEERFRAIVSQATAGIVQTDLTGRFTFANHRYCEIVGYSEAELQSLRMHDITHPDDLPSNAEQFRRLAEGGPDFVVEKRYVRKDGGEVWVNNSVSAVRDAAGRVRSLVAVTLDVTERRRAEEALAEALALNRTITDNTQSCLWMMDTRGRGTFANPASERISGFKPEELIGQALHEKVHHTHPDGTPFPIEECPLDNALPLQEAVVGYEDVFVHKDGHFYPVRCAGRPIIVNGEPVGTVIEVQDITEERRAAAERERLLEEERRHARNLQRLNAASVAINAATSVEEVVRLVNEEARQLTGARMAIVNLVHDGDWNRSRTAPSLSAEYAAWGDYDAQAPGEGIYNLIAREKRTMRMTQAELESHPAWRCFSAEAGNHPPLRGWMATPLLDGGGEFIGVVQLSDKWGGAGEFTEADEALLWQLAQVASVALENQRLYEQEQEAREAAEQATRAKDEFLAVVSHELRSPLNSILGWNRLLRSQRGDDPQIARVTETVERSGKAQLRLIEDLLDTARIISGKMKLETQPVELVAVITSALDVVRPAAASKGIAIVLNFNAEAGQTSYQITGDPDRLQQIVWNLVSNAIKFTPEGGRVWVELRRGGPGVQIIVRDTGQGISPDLLPYIFDRFKQGDSSVSRRFGGLGLGLSLVKHLVELHGGSVTVESQGEGQGATFTVSLPVRAVIGDGAREGRREGQSAVDRRASRGLQTARLEGVRALVVEDEAGARELITLTLEQYGALITNVDSAAAALAALESGLEDGTARAPFDVLITDIGMPGADGYELIRRVRAHADERVSHIRAVALTAYARTEDRLRALRAGFHMHVPKPVDEAELTTVIAALIGRTPNFD